MSSDRKSGYFRPELEKMTGEQRDAYQALRLREILGHAWENAPAIRKRLEGAGIRLDDIGGVDDLEKLPVLKKTELIEEQREQPPFRRLLRIAPSRTAAHLCISRPHL